MIDLDDLERKAKAATPGVWFAWFAEVGKWTIQVAKGWLFESSAHGTKADAAFIASANPAAVLELVQRLRAAEGALDHWRQAALHYKLWGRDGNPAELDQALHFERRAVEAKP